MLRVTDWTVLKTAELVMCTLVALPMCSCTCESGPLTEIFSVPCQRKMCDLSGKECKCGWQGLRQHIIQTLYKAMVRERVGNSTIQSEVLLSLEIMGVCLPFFSTPSILQKRLAVVLSSYEKAIWLLIHLTKSQISWVKVTEREWGRDEEDGGRMKIRW